MNPDAYQFHKLPNTPGNQFMGHHIVSDQVGRAELAVIFRELTKTLNAGIPGNIVELGCYVGTTSLFIRRTLDQHQQSTKREFHVYDSFQGLPEKSQQDQSPAGQQFQAGKLIVSKKDFLKQFHAANLKPPIVHKAWFNELNNQDMPRQIAFAFLDGDFYGSIMDSLKLVWPQMVKGGVILVDDYARPELPGPQRAVADFFRGKPQPQILQQSDIAIIRIAAA